MLHTIRPEDHGPLGAPMAHAVSACVHCGFCLAACPTYRELGQEMDTPRGRIVLMKQVLEGTLAWDAAQPHIDRCLGCLACEPACPSGVPYRDLISPFRALAQEKFTRTPMEKLRRFLAAQTLPYPARFRLAALAGRLGKAFRALVPRALQPMLDLLPENLPPAQRERLLSQLDEVQRLAKIVNGLTLLTKADAGLVSLTREPLHLDDLVRETFEDVHVLAQQQNIEATLIACDETIVLGDRNRLRQLLLNLSDNAIKYNQTGGRLTMALRRHGRSVECAITNTGPGLPPEFQGRVFDRFFRGDPSHNKEVDGCGLGLSIARCIAQLHDGSIGFHSEPGVETTVRVKLPCQPGRKPEPVSEAALDVRA